MRLALMAVALLFLLCHAPGLRVGKLGRVLVLTYFSALRLDAEKCFGACVCVCVGSGRQQFCSNASFRPRCAITGLVGFREQARQMKVPPVDLSSTPEHNAGSWPDSPPPCPYVPGRNSRNLRKRNLRSPIQHVPVRDAGEWHCRRYDPRFPGTRHLTAMGSAMWHFYVGPGRRLL